MAEAVVSDIGAFFEFGAKIALNLTANALVSGIIELFFGNLKPSKYAMLSFFEGVTEITLHQMIVIPMAAAVWHRGDIDMYSISTALCLGPFFLQTALANLQHTYRTFFKLSDSKK